MKSRAQFFIAVGLLILLFDITWFTFSTRNREPLQVFPATINRDCAPWDGAAFTVSIPYDSTSTIMISIWRSPDIKLPTTYSFPDETGQVGNALLCLQAGLPEQLTGRVSFPRVGQGVPVEGEFNLLTEAGQKFKGKFEAEWGNQIPMCG
jgi:hypothetical protein